MIFYNASVISLRQFKLQLVTAHLCLRNGGLCSPHGCSVFRRESTTGRQISLFIIGEETWKTPMVLPRRIELLISALKGQRVSLFH